MNKVKSYLIIVLISLATLVSAQEVPVTGLDTVQFSSDIIPEVTEALKIPFHPQLSNTSDSINIKQYHVPKYPFSFNYKPKTFRPLAFKKSRDKALNNNLIKVGLGVPFNYNLEGYYNSSRSKDLLYATYINHYHLNGGTANRSINVTDFKTFGKKIWKKYILELQLDNGNYLHEFIDPKALIPRAFGDVIANRQNHVQFKGIFENINNDPNLLNYSINASIKHSLSSMYNANGYSTYTNAKIFKNLGPGVLNVQANLRIIELRNENANNNSIVSLKPYYKLDGKDWSVRLGINAAYDGNTLLILPEFYSEKILVEQYLTTYSGWKGNIESRDMEEMLYLNPFWDISTEGLTNTYNNIKYAGFKGMHNAKLSYDIRFERNDVSNNLLFVTDADTNNQNKFIGLYEDMSINSAHISLGYQINTKLSTILENRFYTYTMRENEQEAWHLPTYALTWISHYKLQDLFELDMSIFFHGQTYNRIDETIVTNQSFVDASFGIDYLYNKNLSIFFDINNILNQTYNTWYNYPGIGINVMGGVKLSL